MRRSGLMGLVSLFILATLAAVPPSASSFTLYCSGKSKAQVSRCDTSGYAAVMHRMHWRMYGGHNCTNYAAYRMTIAGVPQPSVLLGNARNWAANAAAAGYLVDQRPAPGAIAQWSKAASHVAYVEEVGPGYLVLSEDSYTSKVYRRYRVEASDRWYPENFIHFRDTGASVAPQKPSLNSTVTVAGPAKISTASRATVTVQVASGDGTAPVGRLSVRRGGKTVATVMLAAEANGAASVTLPRMKRGRQWISAVFDRSPTLRPATSRSLRVVVTKPAKTVASTTTLTVPAAPIMPTERAVVQLRVAAADARAVTNAVSVYVDGTRVAAPVLKAAQRGQVTVALPPQSAGQHRVSATYWGSKTVRRSIAAPQTLTVIDSTTTTGALDRVTARAGEQVTATATVATGRGPVTAGTVAALVDGAEVARATLTPAGRGQVSLPVLATTPGVHHVVLTFVGTAAQSGSRSSSLSLTVTQPTTTALEAEAVGPLAHRAVVRVRVSDVSGNVVGSGAVQIVEGGVTLATGSLAAATDGWLILTLPTLPAGIHRLSATFVGVGLFEPSTSATSLVTIRI